MNDQRRPLYWRLLRLHQVRPNGWQRALLVEGIMGVGALLALAGVAPVWSILVLPIATAIVVKADDVVISALHTQPKT